MKVRQFTNMDGSYIYVTYIADAVLPYKVVAVDSDDEIHWFKEFATREAAYKEYEKFI